MTNRHPAADATGGETTWDGRTVAVSPDTNTETGRGGAWYDHRAKLGVHGKFKNVITFTAA